jgi:hypothetical protein
LKVYKSTVFRHLDKLRIERKLLRNPAKRGARCAFILREEGECVVESIQLTRRSNQQAQGSDGVSSDGATDQRGMFYLIELEPEFHPERFALGFTTTLRERLRAHRRTAPFSQLRKSWPCRAVWERAAIACVAQGCKELGHEVFRAPSLDAVITRCETFFELMPQS